jgi:hypothetical protein
MRDDTNTRANQQPSFEDRERAAADTLRRLLRRASVHDFRRSAHFLELTWHALGSIGEPLFNHFDLSEEERRVVYRVFDHILYVAYRPNDEIPTAPYLEEQAMISETRATLQALADAPAS